MHETDVGGTSPAGGGVDGRGERGNRDGAGAGVAEHLVVAGARHALRLEQRVADAIVGGLGACAVEGLEFSLDARAPRHPQVTP